MSVFKNYMEAKQKLFDHVGFVPDWVEFPIEDNTEMFWYVTDDEVTYAKEMEHFETGECYTDEIYRQRFYSKHVYEGEEYTMIFCDPHVDGCKWFRVFNNSNKVKL